MRLAGTCMIAFSVLASGCASRPSPPSLVPTGESLPPWNYPSAASVVRTPPSGACLPDPIRGSLVGLQLLAWRTVDLGTSERNEALWWGYFLTATGPQWLLAMTFHEPIRNSPGSWRFSRSPYWGALCGRPIYHRLASPPTNSDLLEFFRNSGAADITRLPRGVDAGDWFHPTMLPGSRWALRQVVVRATVWEAVLGGPPPPEFRP